MISVCIKRDREVTQIGNSNIPVDDFTHLEKFHKSKTEWNQGSLLTP